MTREQAIYSPGLSSVESQKFCPGTQIRSRDELPSLSLGISKTLPLSSALVDQPATEPLLQITICNTHCFPTATVVESARLNVTLISKLSVQASLVIRDLTLRVFAITRFREKKP